MTDAVEHSTLLERYVAQLNNQEEGSWHVLQDAIELFKGEEE